MGVGTAKLVVDLEKTIATGCIASSSAFATRTFWWRPIPTTAVRIWRMAFGRSLIVGLDATALRLP